MMTIEGMNHARRGHGGPGRRGRIGFGFATTLVFAVAGVARAQSPAEAGTDPFAPFLDGTPPKITREIATVPDDIRVRRVLFRTRDKNEAYAVIAAPKAAGKHPGILVLHGSGGSAEEERAMAWAQRGYIAVAPDMPGLYSPLTHGDLPMNKGYAAGRYSVQPDTTRSVIFDGMLAAMKALDLLRSQPDVDTDRIGVVGVSWGGTMTTMVCGLAGDRVRAGFSVYGCGFFDRGGWRGSRPNPGAASGSLAANMTPEERDRWLRDLDPGRRAANIKASFFLAAATNDFFGWPDAVQATLDAIPGDKNHLYAPNCNHKVLVPGGTGPGNFGPGTGTPQFPGDRANFLAMEVPFFDYHLRGLGKPFPKISLRRTDDDRLVRFSVVAPHPLTNTVVYWAKAHPIGTTDDPEKLRKAELEREWSVVAATATAENVFEARLPADAGVWFALISDDRPVTVSSDMVHAAASDR